MKKFDGKTVLVTGASSGIGEATAALFQREGARVYGLASREETAAEAKKRHPAIEWLVADLASPAAIVPLANRIERLDVLVNNAGIYEFAPLAASDAAMVRRQFEINVLGLVAITQAFLAKLVEARGTIVNVSSTSAKKSAASQSIYAATKAAVEALTRSWAVELGPSGVRVNAVAPGPTMTPGIARLPFPKEVMEGMHTRLAATLPLGRLGTSEEVAYGIAALADPAAAWLTGQSLAVDGGMLAI